MNLLKRLTCCCFMWQCDDIPDVKGSYNFPVRAIGDRLIACFFLVSNHEYRVCLTYMYIQHRNRVYGLLRIYHVPVLDPIAYGNAYSTLWYYMVLCVDQKMSTVATGCYYKHFHIFARNRRIILNMILPFCPLSFTCSFI